MSPYSKSQLKIVRTILALVVWASLIPFVHATPLAVAFYGAVLALAMGIFTLVRRVILRPRREDADLAGHHRRVHITNVISTALYAASVPLAFVSVWIAFAIFILSPVLYFLADRMLGRPSDPLATK